MQSQFLTYLRTKYFLSGIVGKYEIAKEPTIYIPKKELAERFFPYPKYDLNAEIQSLVDSNSIDVFKHPTSKGYYYTYKPKVSGAIDLSLIERKSERLSPLHLKMIEYLKRASLPNDIERTRYFDLFQAHKNGYAQLFFIVDSFAKRVHTPISNQRKTTRPHLLIDGMPTAAIDVVTMQPLVLGFILYKLIGDNEFSTWINEGKDIYSMLQSKANLPTRAEGKNLFFKLIFGYPSNDVIQMFGSSNWVMQINNLKTIELKENPHNKTKPYTNIAWLLQNLEVKTMTKVWQLLANKNIPFLTVHDEVICKQADAPTAKELMSSVFAKEFEYFKFTVTPEPTPPQEPTPPKQLNIDDLHYYFDDYCKDITTGKGSLNVNYAPMTLYDGTIIKDIDTFLIDHMKAATTYRNSPKPQPYLNRLNQFFDLLELISILE